MASSFIQVAHIDDAVNNNFASILQGANPTTGNCLVVCTYVGFGAVSSVTSVTDTKLNTYVQANDGTTAADQISQDTSRRVEVWVAKNISGGSANTVKATWGSSQTIKGFTVLEYSGPDTATPVENVSKASAASGVIDPGTSSPAENNAIIVATANHSTGTPPTPATGFTDRYTVNVGGGVAVATEDEVQTTATSRTAFWSGTTDNWAAIAVVLRPATGGGATSAPGNTTQFLNILGNGK